MKGAPMHQGLLEAALSGDISSLSGLSDEALLNEVDAGGNTVAHIASRHGHSEFLGEILRRCPYLLNLRNFNQLDTPLHCAARVRNDACIRILLDVWRSHTPRPRPPASATNGATSLTTSKSISAEAVDEKRDRDRPEEKIAEGADNIAEKVDAHLDNITKWVNRRGNTALHEAVRKQRVAVVHTLLEADPSLAFITNNNGESALGIAHRISSSEIVEILLKYETGSSSNQEGKNGIHATVCRDNRILII